MKKLLTLLSIILITTSNAFACNTCIGKSEKDPFVASSGIPFKKLMTDSMHLMDDEMDKVNLNKKNEIVFLKMMIAHHQGAIDMANSILVHSNDVVLKNYATTIIANQHNEIQYMKNLLKKFEK